MKYLIIALILFAFIYLDLALTMYLCTRNGINWCL